MEEELDEMVLAMWAIEAFKGYSPRQQERMTRYVRSLATYDVTRPAWKRPSAAATASNVVDLETHVIRRKLEPAVRSARKSALAHGAAVHQTYAYGVNCFGDDVFADINEDGYARADADTMGPSLASRRQTARRPVGT